MKRKQLNVAPLRNAERAFFDSVLGYEGLSSEIIQHLLTSISPAEKEDADQEQEKESFDCLVASLAAATERKRELVALDQLLADIDSMLPDELVLADGSNYKLRTGEQRHDVSAKADVLLKRHKRLPGLAVQRHLDSVSDRLNDEMLEILANEARLACDLAKSEECDAATKETTKHLLTFIRNEFEKNKGGVLCRLEREIVIELCEYDFSLFDSYLSYLLKQHYELSTRPADRTMELVKDGVLSLKQAANEKMKAGVAEDLDLEEVRDRLVALTKRRGYVVRYCVLGVFPVANLVCDS